MDYYVVGRGFETKIVQSASEAELYDNARGPMSAESASAIVSMEMHRDPIPAVWPSNYFPPKRR